MFVKTRLENILKKVLNRVGVVAINKYTQAMKLAKYCGEKLNDATKKVNKILTEDNELKEFNAE